MEADSLSLYDGGKRYTLFIIDFGQHVFDAGVDKFKMALQGVRNQINDLCCSGDINEWASVIFMNTAISNSAAQNIDCIYVHRSMGLLDAEYVKEFDSLLKTDDIFAKLSETLGEPGSCNFSELLFLCQSILSKAGTVVRRKRIFFFTVDHEPLAENILKNVQNIVKDLKEAKTHISVFLMGNEVDEDFNPFWFELDPNTLVCTSIKQLHLQIKRKNFSLRATVSVPFRLSNDFEFAVGVYGLIRTHTLPKPILLNSETNEPVECKSHYIPANKATVPGATKEEPREAEEMEHFEGEVNFRKNFGGVEIVLERKELEKLRRFDNPGITLIGFKPLSLLKPSHRMGFSKFIYPIEEAISGSGTLYRALLKKCLERELFILVRYTEKTNTTPQLAALLPQGKLDEDDQHSYEGFHLIELPFSEDKRKLKEKYLAIKESAEQIKASDQEIEVAQNFVSRLTTKYTPYQFSNPVLQRFYRGLEAFALDHGAEFADETVDQIRPYYENLKLKSRVSKELEAFKSCFSTKNEEIKKPPSKRAKKLNF